MLGLKSHATMHVFSSLLWRREMSGFIVAFHFPKVAVPQEMAEKAPSSSIRLVVFDVVCRSTEKKFSERLNGASPGEAARQACSKFTNGKVGRPMPCWRSSGSASLMSSEEFRIAQGEIRGPKGTSDPELPSDKSIDNLQHKNGSGAGSSKMQAFCDSLWMLGRRSLNLLLPALRVGESTHSARCVAPFRCEGADKCRPRMHEAKASTGAASTV
jgi:hypothetical protein